MTSEGKEQDVWEEESCSLNAGVKAVPTAQRPFMGGPHATCQL